MSVRTEGFFFVLNFIIKLKINYESLNCMITKCREVHFISSITKKQVDRSNYPFCTIDPNVGVVAVPDNRVDELANLTNSAKKIFTTNSLLNEV